MIPGFQDNWRDTMPDGWGDSHSFESLGATTVVADKDYIIPIYDNIQRARMGTLAFTYWMGFLSGDQIRSKAYPHVSDRDSCHTVIELRDIATADWIWDEIQIDSRDSIFFWLIKRYLGAIKTHHCNAVLQGDMFVIVTPWLKIAFKLTASVWLIRTAPLDKFHSYLKRYEQVQWDIGQIWDMVE